MPRRAALLPGLLAALAIAACNTAQPTGPVLTDPREILTQAARATAAAKSAHFTVIGSGTLAGGLPGLPPGVQLRLDGATIEGDFDVPGEKFGASFSVPAVFNLSGEIVQVGETAWLKSSLTGGRFQPQPAARLPLEELTPAAVDAAVQSILDTPGISPTKVDDARCGDNKDCYQVRIELTAQQLAALASGAPFAGGLDLGDGTLALTIGVEKDTLRMSRLVVSAMFGDETDGDLTLDLSRWDAPVAIDPPPADEVGG